MPAAGLAQHHRGVCFAQRRRDQGGVHVAPHLRHPVGGSLQCLGVLDRYPRRRIRLSFRRAGTPDDEVKPLGVGPR